ncbi:MAG: hypothetical protein ABI977_21810 [Acidobacteriota bacterium]
MAKGDQLNTGSAGTAVAYSEATEPTRSADEIRQDIAARRESITDTVDRLSDRFQQTFDWRTYITNYPLVALGLAAGLGLLASSILKPRATPTERMKDALADCFEDVTDRFRSQMDDVTMRRPGISQTVKAAATGLLVKTAADFVRNRVSGSNTQRGHDHERMTSSNRMSRTDVTEEWASQAPVRR